MGNEELPGDNGSSHIFHNLLATAYQTQGGSKSLGVTPGQD